MASDESGWDTPEKVAELRAELGNRLTEPALGDAQTLRRFLRARAGDPPKAAEMLLRHQEWRQAECPWWPTATTPLDNVVSVVVCAVPAR
jgi:hypothetical protein